VRTDYSDEVAWRTICELIVSHDCEEYVPTLMPLEDRAYEGATAADLFARADSDLSYFFIVDSEAISDPEHPVLVVDNEPYSPHPGRTFRTVPAEVSSIDANLGISNMDFSEFADSVDADGVFRGFGPES
jgi:hypothetical protein